jgi:ankyrin repeat protein
MTALMFAAGTDSLDVARYLIRDLGADVNQATSTGMTALILAAQSGHVNIVRYLVKELGANVNEADSIA